MTNPFAVARNAETNSGNLPTSSAALLVIGTVGVVELLAIVGYIVLKFQEKDTGQLDTIITGGMVGLIGLLSRTSATPPPVVQPLTPPAPTPVALLQQQDPPPPPAQPPAYRPPPPALTGEFGDLIAAGWIPPQPQGAAA